MCQNKRLAVSYWHSLPNGTGTFPAAKIGVTSLCVRCEDVLLLPPRAWLLLHATKNL